MESSLEKTDFIVLYKYMPYEAFVATVETWTLKASFPYEVNDPLENVIQKNKHLPPELLKDSSLGYISPFFSFSRNMSSSAMWGQYADWGRGVCLVFAFPIRDDSVEWIAGEKPGIFNPLICDKEQAVPLLYQEERFKINYDAKSRINKTPIVMNRWLNDCIIVKGKHWEYESEVRIHTSYGSATHEKNGILSYQWPMQYLIGAIAGPKCKQSRQYIKQKIQLCKAAFLETNDNVKLSKNIVVAQAKAHDVRFEYVAPPFFDKVDSRLFYELVLSDSLLGLHYTVITYYKNWNEWINNVYNKELLIVNKYISKIKTLIKQEFSTHLFHESEIDGLVYYLTHSIVFKNTEIIQDMEILRERIKSYFKKNVMTACNSQMNSSIDILKIANFFSNATLSKIVKLILEMHTKRDRLIINEVKKNDKSIKPIEK